MIRSAAVALKKLFGRDPLARLCFDAAEALRQRLTFGIEQRRSAGAGNRIDGLAQRNLAGERRFDHLGDDDAIVVAATLVRIAITLDEAGAFRDLVGEV